MFDYDDSVNLAYNAKTAGKNLIAAKHELFNKTGEFLFLAHSDREFAMRCQMIEQDIEGVAYRRLASLSDSKAKLVRAAFDEWTLRHAKCTMCKTSSDRLNGNGPIVVQVEHRDRTVQQAPVIDRIVQPAPVIRSQSTQVPSLDMHHVECGPTGCHPECRIKLPPKGVQSQINL